MALFFFGRTPTSTPTDATPFAVSDGISTEFWRFTTSVGFGGEKKNSFSKPMTCHGTYPEADRPSPQKN